MKEKLFDQFPPVTTEAWKDKIRADLKGADYSKKLIWKTNEGFDVNPFYRTEDIEKLSFTDFNPGEFPYVRGNKTLNNNWLVRQDIEVTGFSDANRKALKILNRGVDSLGFIIFDPNTVSTVNFRMLLERIHLHAIELNIHCNGKAKEILDIICNLADEKRTDISKFKGGIEADPIVRLMVNGTLCIPPESGFDYLAALTLSAQKVPLFRTIHLNGSVFGNSGTDLAEELGFSIAIGCEYMVQLISRGISAELAAAKIRFSFGTGSSYFTEIAKLRAARLLWSVVLNRFGVKDTRMEIHCVTSQWNKTVYDPYVNMLRSQTEAMSAILGGADSLTIEPFDKVFRTPDDFSERIARNQQLILKEESHFDKVADPSAGSYYVESLTENLSDMAWTHFLDIEEHGGFLETIKSGYIQERISKSASKRRLDYATRKSVLLGTSQYPNNSESVSSSTNIQKLFESRNYEKDLIVEPVVPFRVSEEFEKIRIAVDRCQKRPSVFLLPIGNPLMRNARAQFSSVFFACAGYRILDNSGFSTVEESVLAAKDSGAEIVVICSSDDEYITYAPEIFSGLKNYAQVVIAGNPGSAEALKSIGLELFIHMRTNVPEMLSKFNNLLGIKM